MAYLNTIAQTSRRRGIQYRKNSDRFFEIRQLGWFYYQRGTSEEYQGIELTLGICGPFTSLPQAQQHLEQIIERAQTLQKSPPKRPKNYKHYIHNGTGRLLPEVAWANGMN